MTDRHTASTIDDDVLDKLYDDRDQLAATLREVLNAFSTARDDGTRTVVGYMSAPIHPTDMDRWRAVLEPAKEQH